MERVAGRTSADVLVLSPPQNHLELAVKNKDDIYQLTTSLLPPTYDTRARKEHWGRFAFLCDCCLTYPTTVLPKDRNKITIWNHVDDRLVSVRTLFKTTYSDPTTRKLQESLFFAQILQKDITRFPIRSGGVAQTAVMGNQGIPNIQLLMEKTVAGFVVEDTNNGGAAASAASNAINIAAQTTGGSSTLEEVSITAAGA
ncbi:hypothetical protein C8Q72DRAFT_946667 [Fomitopsis betulina]|nr:hypothetical protein C8Q72DRAFT_946667 [Fomitopsis betulina]